MRRTSRLPAWLLLLSFRDVLPNMQVPFVAHKQLGDTYKWLLYGDDDTVWFMDGVLKFLEDLDPDMPYFISGTPPAPLPPPRKVQAKHALFLSAYNLISGKGHELLDVASIKPVSREEQMPMCHWGCHECVRGDDKVPPYKPPPRRYRVKAYCQHVGTRGDPFWLSASAPRFPCLSVTHAD